MSNWIKSYQNDVLLNLDNMADIIVKNGQVKGYTPSGFGITIFQGSEEGCNKVIDTLTEIVSAHEV